MENGFDCGDIVIIESYSYEHYENCVEIGIVLGYVIAKLYYREDKNSLIVKDNNEFIGNVQAEAKKSDNDMVTLRNFNVVVQHICYIDKEALGMKEAEVYINAMYKKALNKVLNPLSLYTYSGYNIKRMGKNFDGYSNYLLKSAMVDTSIKEYLTYISTKEKIFDKIEKLSRSYDKKLMSFDDLVETKDFETGKVYIREETKGKETVYRFLLGINCNSFDRWNFLTLKGGVKKEDFMKEYIAITSEITTTNRDRLRNWLETVRKRRNGQYVVYKEKFKYYSTTIGVADKEVCRYL